MYPIINGKTTFEDIQRANMNEREPEEVQKDDHQI